MFKVTSSSGIHADFDMPWLNWICSKAPKILVLFLFFFASCRIILKPNLRIGVFCQIDETCIGSMEIAVIARAKHLNDLFPTRVVNMKNRTKLLPVIALTYLFGISNAFAVPSFVNLPVKKPKPRPTPIIKAPEIKLESGTTAMALIAGVLLLLGERYRSAKS